MSNPGSNLVEIDLSHTVLDDEGVPVEKEMKRYAYFTFRSISEMYKRMGVDEEQAMEYADNARDADSEDASQQFRDLAESEVNVGEVESTYYLIWAALQWDARQRGEKITPDEVGDWLTPQNAERILIQVRRALHLFQTGTLPSFDKMSNLIEKENEEERENEGADAGGNGKGKSRSESAGAVGSPR